MKSQVKRNHVSNYKYTIGEELQWKLKAKNKYSSHSIMVLAKEKKVRIEKQAKDWIPDALVEILFPFMKTEKNWRR